MPEATQTAESTAFTSHIREMLEAALSGDTTTVRTLLDIAPKLANVVDSDYATPLHNTVESNNVEIAEALIAAGADINAKYKQTGHTPLSWAVTYGSFDVAHALLRGGAILDLWCAAGMGDLEATKSFWDAQGRLADQPSTTGSSRYDAQGQPLPRPPATMEEVLGDALYIAARNGHTEVVKFLLARGADVHFRGFCGGTPLHWAYFANSKPVIDLLLAHGADPESLDDNQQATPRAFGVLEVTSFGMAGRLRAMLAVDPTLVSCQGLYGTPLDIARKNRNEEIVALLESVIVDDFT